MMPSPPAVIEQAPVTIVLPPLRGPQNELFIHPAKELVVLGAVQTVGKTYGASAWALARGITRKSIGWWAAPTHKQAEVAYTKLKDWSVESRILARSRMEPMRLHFKQGTRIDFVSWERDENLLGPSVDWMVIDQAELLTSQAHSILVSRLAATLGPIRYLGNANVAGSQFHKIAIQAQDPMNQPRMAFLKWTWADHAAVLSGSERAEYEASIDYKRRTMLPSEFAQLYEAEWATPEESLFDEETIQKLFCLDPSSAPHPGHRYAIGWDIGLRRDYTVGAVLCLQCMTVDNIVRLRGGDSTRFKSVIAETCKHWNNALGVVELNDMGQAIFDELTHLYPRVQGWWTNNENKRAALLQIISLAREGKLKLAKVPEMLEEFRVFRSLRSPASLVWSFSAPEGMHDDTVMAVAIAVGSASSGPAAYLQMLEDEVRERRAGASAAGSGRLPRKGEPVRA